MRRHCPGVFFKSLHRNMTSYVRGTFTLNAHQKATVGDCKFSVINSDHMGWLKCDGSSKSKNDFYLLWRVIGYSFGGSGDSFRLPDARGTVPGVVGTGNDANLSSFTYALGQQVGEYNHTLTINEMPTHNHGVTDPGHAHTQTTINDDFNNSGTYGGDFTRPSYPNSDGSGTVTWTGTINSNTTGITIQNTGGSNYHNNIQPTLPIGNMFIYCGRPTYPFAGFPYTEGTQIL
jgi:microcystin-dependent protein